jgi:hypothetical protein
MSTPFEAELAALINRHSKENGSNTPDYILANFLNTCLEAYNKTNIWRAKWFHPDGVPAGEIEDGPQPPHVMGDLSPRPGMLTVFEATNAGEARKAIPELKRGWSNQDHQLLKDAEASLHENSTDK